MQILKTFQKGSSKINSKTSMFKNITCQYNPSKNSSSNSHDDLKDLFRKIKVHERGVIVEKEFRHKYKPGSTLFVSADNELLLEYNFEYISIYTISNDQKTHFLDDLKRPPSLYCPTNFSPDFSMVIQFEFSQKKKQEDESSKQNQFKLQIYKSAQNIDVYSKAKQYDKFRPMDNLFLPDFEMIQKNESGIPYVNLTSNSTLRYLNINNIDQTIPLCPKEELSKRKDEINEIFITKDKLNLRLQFDMINLWKNNCIPYLSNSEKLDLKSRNV